MDLSLGIATIQEASTALMLLAQTGGTKTAVGWAVVLLCIGLGLLVVCRPSERKAAGKGK
jgi:ABC-type sulfate transport system permease component